MAQPTRSDVHVSRPLTNISIAYIQKATDFVADKIFPVVPVAKQADRYFVYNKSYWFSTRAEKRAPSSESAGSGFDVDNTPNYFCDVFAVHMDVDDQIRANADEPLNMDRDATQFVTQQMMLKRELTFMSKYLATGTWQGFLVSGSAVDFAPATHSSTSKKWDESGSDPLKDVSMLQQAMKSQTGYMGNVLAVTMNVHTALLNHAVILDRIKYTQKGIITEDLLAALFNVSKYVVIQAVKNTANEKTSGAGTYAFVESNKILLAYAAPAPSILQPSAGYIFAWKGLFGAGAQGNRISSFRMEHKKSDRIEGEMAYDQKQVSADLGILGVSMLATP